MAIVEQRPVVVADEYGSEVHWKPVIAGAISAAALSFVLITFGAGLGLAVSSTSPTWRDTSEWLWVLSGVFLIFTALVSFGFGGYVAGRMRARIATVAAADEMDFRDGMHGLLVWGLAIVFAAILAVAGASAVSPAAAPASATESVAGENTIAYELDQLFRSDRPLRDPNIVYTRAEAARILLTSSGHSGVSAEDRDYLTRLVASRADVPDQEAAARVERAIPAAHDALKRARQSGVMIAFMTAAALLLGAVVAWYAAREGGREREIGGAPVWRWSLVRQLRT
jgi:hypothetical protein